MTIPKLVKKGPLCGSMYCNLVLQGRKLFLQYLITGAGISALLQGGQRRSFIHRFGRIKRFYRIDRFGRIDRFYRIRRFDWFSKLGKQAGIHRGCSLSEFITADVTISKGIFLQIILMILFCRKEILNWLHLHHNLSLGGSLFFCNKISCNLSVSFICIINSSAILGASVVSLLIEAIRIDDVKIQIQQVLQAHHRGIIPHLHRFRVASRASTNLLIARLHHRTLAITRQCILNSRYQCKILFHTPKAASCKIHHSICSQRLFYHIICTHCLFLHTTHQSQHGRQNTKIPPQDFT